MSRKPLVILVISALGAVVLFSSVVLLAASDTALDSGKGSAQSSKDLSGSGDVRKRRGGSASGERAGDAVSANPEARLSNKPEDAERLIENPEKQEIAKD